MAKFDMRPVDMCNSIGETDIKPLDDPPIMINTDRVPVATAVIAGVWIVGINDYATDEDVMRAALGEILSMHINLTAGGSGRLGIERRAQVIGSCPNDELIAS